MTSATRHSLVVFTGSYPYSAAAEGTFVGPELPHLAAHFERVFIVPAALDGDREPLSAPAQVDEDFAQAVAPNRLRLASVANAFCSRVFYQELYRRPATLLQPRALAKLIRCAGNARRTARWLPEFVRRHGIEPERTVFYSYWLGSATLGAGDFVRRHGGVAVSRAHGGDVYHERHRPAYIPCHAAMLRGIRALFLACEDARRYITARFPDDAPECVVCHLGVVNAGEHAARASSDGVFRLVSCAYVTPVKRMELLVQGLALAGRTQSNRRIEWDHFGGGSHEAELTRLAAELLPDNVSWRLHGSVPNAVIQKHYEQQPVDLFVTVSASEGGVPVSIMEAQSHGIPVLATAVGGIPDIIGSENGVLLGANPAPDQVASGLGALMDAGMDLGAMREASRRICAEHFSADTNFERFAERLRGL